MMDFRLPTHVHRLYLELVKDSKKHPRDLGHGIFTRQSFMCPNICRLEQKKTKQKKRSKSRTAHVSGPNPRPFLSVSVCHLNFCQKGTETGKRVQVGKCPSGRDARGILLVAPYLQFSSPTSLEISMTVIPCRLSTCVYASTELAHQPKKKCFRVNNTRSRSCIGFFDTPYFFLNP